MQTLQEGSITPEKMEHHIPTWQKVLSMVFIVFGFLLPVTTPFVIFIFERMETRGKMRLAGHAVLGSVCGVLVAGAFILNSLLGINLIPQVLVLVILFLVGRCKCHQDRYQVKNVLYFALFSSSLFLNAIVIANTLISLDVTPSLPLTVDFWLVFEENLDSIIQIISTLFFTAVFLNRLAMNLLAKEEGLFKTGRVPYWKRLVNVFKWKNKRTSLRSGNETLMKVKNASKILALTCFMLLILLPLLPDIDMTGILDFLAGDGSFDVLEIRDLVIAGFFVILAGFPFILSHMLTWFYMGRMVSYQGKAVARQQGRIWFFMVPIGWIISATAFIPLVLSLLEVSFNTIVTMSLVLNIIAMLALGWIVFQAWLNPKHLLLDPKVKCRKLEAGMIQATRCSSREGLLKRACHGFLIAVVLGISVLNGIIWFQATVAYGKIVHWYEWGFYFWLGVLFIVGPVVLLFFLDSIYIRRLLMGYFAIVLLLLAQQLFKVIPLSLDFMQFISGIALGGRFGYTEIEDTFSTSQRPGQVLMVIMTAVLAFMAFYVIKRKALPVEVTTPKHGRRSSIINLKHYITRGGQKHGPKTTIGLIFFVVTLSGMLVTFQPPAKIVLERPDGHEMQVSFWDSGLDLPNEVLDMLGEHDINIHGWLNGYDLANALRYQAYNVSVVKHLSMPLTQGELESKLDDANNLMDYWDANGLQNAPFLGFTFDEENARGVSRFNETAYWEAMNVIDTFVNNVTARGYQVFSTEYLVPINDLLDGDHDVAINNFNPFDPAWNVTHFDWMIYRSEPNILYDEPHEFFTYEWARSIKHFLTKLGGESLADKASMSIGVTGDDFPLYQDPGGFEEFMKDVKICHGMGIGEIKIFYLGNAEPSDENFLGKWGVEGIQNMMNVINTYDKVVIPFKRRASFLGNLKLVDNPTGSVFGLFYQDYWLDEWLGMYPLAWAIGICVSIVAFMACRNATGRRMLAGSKVSPAAREKMNKYLRWVRLSMFLLIAMLLAWFLSAFWYPDFGELIA